MALNHWVPPPEGFWKRVGFATSPFPHHVCERTKGVIQKALQKTFSPEFLNRIDDVLVFNSLGKEEIHKIIDIVLAGVYARLEKLGYNIELTSSAKDFLSEKGYDPQFGARPLHRAIQKYVEDPLAEEILRSNAKPGDTFTIELNKE